MFRSFFLPLVIALMFPSYGASDADALPASVVEFFDLNCYECHNDVDQKGELDLESLRLDPTNSASMKTWGLIHDRVRDREMPPKEEFEVESDELRAFLRTFEQTLHDASKDRQEVVGRVRSRRLSRIEYENTLHDLLGVNIPIKERLPEDSSGEGFGNVAESQQISYHLLEKYLELIDLLLDEAFDRALNSPPSYKNRYVASELSVGGERSRNEREGVYNGEYALVYPTTHGFHGRMSATTVSETGWYRIRIKAKAFKAPEGRSIWAQVHTGVLRAKAPLTYWVGNIQGGKTMEEYSFDAWIRKDHMIGIRPGDRTLEWVNFKHFENSAVLDMDFAGLAVEEVEVERIYPGLNLAELRRRLFGDLEVEDGKLNPSQDRQDLYRLLSEFAERAFRRPVTKQQLAPYFRFARKEMTTTGSFLLGLKAGYRAILCSPRFIYFTEEPGELDDFGIASRLSYFLWSSLPDEELLMLAKAGRLSRPEVLAAQVDRLLEDPKAEAFIRNFADDWLELKDIDFTTPDGKLYPEYDDILKYSMLGETHAFLRELIEKDLSVANVIDSDFAMLNERIARHYGIEGVRDSEFTRVPLEAADRRGGIITQGSVLKVTANGTTTSPIVRGVWLMERILGQHISPPPDQVPAVEPDIRGAVSIRDQLDKHRSTESCMACHQKIDPPGFALESYDVIGGWRQRYRAIKSGKKWTDGPLIDPSHQFSNGKAFDDIEGFKEIVLSDPGQIARNLLEQVLTYATGAEIEFADRREIDRIVEELAGENYGFRSLIHAAAQSSIFRSK